MPLLTPTRFESVDDAINSCSPKFHLPLTDLSGSTISDVSGNGRNATLVGTVTLNNLTAPDGRPAALFAGGHLEITGHVDLAASANYGITLGAIVKLNAVPAGNIFLISKANTAKFEWGTMFTATPTNGQFEMSIWNPAGNSICHRRTTNSPIGTSWMLVLSRCQSSTAASLVQLFHNSVVPCQVTSTAPSGSGYVTDAATPVWIGARQDGVGTPLAGYIRHAFMVNEAIDQGQIQRIVLAMQRDGWGF